MWMANETVDLIPKNLEVKEQIKIIDNIIQEQLSNRHIEYKYPEKYSCSIKKIKKKNSTEESCPIGVSRIILIENNEYLLHFSYSLSFSHDIGLKNIEGIYELHACRNQKEMFNGLEKLIKQTRKEYELNKNEILEKLNSLKRQINKLELLIK